MLITRYYHTKTLPVTVEFLTPTFLGGADQNAELRAAPFKNLLRQWWRVALGSQYASPADMLSKESELFGSVLDDKPSASLARLELSAGDGFEIIDNTLLDCLGKTKHPEVKGGMPISNALYLGYGPVSTRGVRRYITAGSTAMLTLTFPKQYLKELLLVLAYIDSFGAIGSRCRNGWGSLSLSCQDFQWKPLTELPAHELSRLVNGTRQYPTHLGKDGKGLLCWQLKQPPSDWKKAMQALAEVYMNLRTNINIKPQGLQKRHILGYPVTNHSAVPNWGGKDGRMPSQLRLMVKRDQQGHLVGRILHLPHKLPKDWAGPPPELEIWQEIHDRLDKASELRRCGETR